MAPRFSGKFLYSSISCVRKHDEILLFCYNSSYRKTVYERKLLEMIKKLAVLFKNDIVLLISFCLALLSCLITPPGPEYLGYLDFHTLILLFCLMLIVEGLRESNFFPYIGNLLLSRTSSKRGLSLVLVFLCFVSSMFITNDVALITFVPFGILILEMAGMESRICYLIVLMTIAANLGSMFTPVGNPQNLYLYSLSGLKLHEFLLLMLPFTALSAALLVLFALLGTERGSIRIQMENTSLTKKGTLLFLGLLFLFCMLSVAGILSDWILLILIVIPLLIHQRTLFTRVDYSLLLTFIFFFIFVGNIDHFEQLRVFISSVLAHHERIISILASQIISNVPAAMLLSNYTAEVQELIIGTNLGGLGTLIASMASLISYRQISARYPRQKGKYFVIFTICNVIFLLILYLVFRCF